MNAEQAYRSIEAALTKVLATANVLQTKAVAEAQTALAHLKRDDKRLPAETQKAQMVAQESFFNE